MGAFKWLFSMSDSRHDMMWFFRKNTGEIIGHLLFMIYFPENPAFNHWRGEVFGFLPHLVPTFKGSHRFPKLDFIEQNLYLWILDSDANHNAFVKEVKHGGLQLPEDFESNFYLALAKVGAILHEVSLVLVSSHDILFREYSDILEKYGL
jgi:hypothetical protein